MTEKNWQSISRNLGWMTFEDIIEKSIDYDTFENSEVKDWIVEFFGERNLRDK